MFLQLCYHFPLWTCSSFLNQHTVLSSSAFLHICFVLFSAQLRSFCCSFSELPDAWGLSCLLRRLQRWNSFLRCPDMSISFWYFLRVSLPPWLICSLVICFSHDSPSVIDILNSLMGVTSLCAVFESYGDLRLLRLHFSCFLAGFVILCLRAKYCGK